MPHNKERFIPLPCRFPRALNTYYYRKAKQLKTLPKFLFEDALLAYFNLVYDPYLDVVREKNSSEELSGNVNCLKNQDNEDHYRQKLLKKTKLRITG